MHAYIHAYIHTYAHKHACTHTNGNPRHFSPAPFPSTPAASREAFSSSTRWMRHRSISKPPDALRTLSFQLRARSRPPPSITGPTCPQRHTRKHTRKRTRTQSDMVSYQSYTSHSHRTPSTHNLGFRAADVMPHQPAAALELAAHRGHLVWLRLVLIGH